ncbi:Hypothetical_protein [Hexamita inflata]|uniref:Hypothetical_protein n=1 Tax=Hexamita inflata TaxID=28002 RepID=A0AA86TSF5_9EUKA|nr:Hypothetical protein HINF_LOCUS14834 [Hexamita inflata]
MTQRTLFLSSRKSDKYQMYFTEDSEEIEGVKRKLEYEVVQLSDFSSAVNKLADVSLDYDQVTLNALCIKTYTTQNQSVNNQDEQLQFLLCQQLDRLQFHYSQLRDRVDIEEDRKLQLRDAIVACLWALSQHQTCSDVYAVYIQDTSNLIQAVKQLRDVEMDQFILQIAINVLYDVRERKTARKFLQEINLTENVQPDRMFLESGLQKHVVRNYIRTLFKYLKETAEYISTPCNIKLIKSTFEYLLQKPKESHFVVACFQFINTDHAYEFLSQYFDHFYKLYSYLSSPIQNLVKEVSTFLFYSQKLCQISELFMSDFILSQLEIATSRIFQPEVIQLTLQIIHMADLNNNRSTKIVNNLLQLVSIDIDACYDLCEFFQLHTELLDNSVFAFQFFQQLNKLFYNFDFTQQNNRIQKCFSAVADTIIELFHADDMFCNVFKTDCANILDIMGKINSNKVSMILLLLE